MLLITDTEILLVVPGAVRTTPAAGVDHVGTMITRQDDERIVVQPSRSQLPHQHAKL